MLPVNLDVQLGHTLDGLSHGHAQSGDMVKLLKQHVLSVLCMCRVSFSPSSSPLRFVLSMYDLDGTWLGLKDWTVQLQTCGANVDEASLWTR